MDDFASGRALGIMQPYFFPYLGYFSLIAHTDCWVVFDTSQYRPKSWMNRNRILHPTRGWQYITVPLSNSSIHIKTNEAALLQQADSHARIRRQLEHYRRFAPFYSETMTLLNEAFSHAYDASLVSLNVASLSGVCRYLDIPFRHRLCSELDLDLPSELGPGDWAPEIASRLGAAVYVNPVGGRALFDPAHFRQRGVALRFLRSEVFEYTCTGYTFEPNLSVLDVLMWNPPEVVANAVRGRCNVEGAA